MTLPRYEEYEGDFLEAMATRFGFSGKTRLVFEKRFLEDNAELKDNSLANGQRLAEKLLKGAGKVSDPATILRDRLKVICDKLAEAGCEFNGARQGKWKIAKRWLREEIYPQWLAEQGLGAPPPTREQLWQQLVAQSTPTNKMRPVIVKEQTLDMWQPESSDEIVVPLGSRIYFDVDLEIAGHLTLLEKATSGDIFCLCPSSLFAPAPNLPAGRARLPQENARQKWFKITGNLGSEQIVAAITVEAPPLDWLPEGTQPPLKLQESHLSELLNYFQKGEPSELLFMEYRIIG